MKKMIFSIAALMLLALIGANHRLVAQETSYYGLPIISISQVDGKVQLNVQAGSISNRIDPEFGYELLAVKEVRDELDLVDAQVTEMKNIYVRLQERLDDAYGNISPEEFQDKLLEIQEFTATLREDAKTQLGELLLPEQIARLNNHRYRRKIKHATFLDVLLSDEVSEKIRITSTQEAQLRKKNKSLEDELRMKIEQLQLEYRNKLIADLDENQKDEVVELFGNDFFGK